MMNELYCYFPKVNSAPLYDRIVLELSISNLQSPISNIARIPYG